MIVNNSVINAIVSKHYIK